MKKLLAILSSVIVISSASTLSVACTLGVPNNGNVVKPDEPGVEIPKPSKPTYPNSELPSLPPGDQGIEIIPDGERFPDFVDPVSGMNPSKETIAALQGYIKNLKDFIETTEYQTILKNTLEQIKTKSDWEPPFELSVRDSNNEGMMRYFYLYRNSKFLQDYEKKVFDILIYQALLNHHMKILNEDNIAQSPDFIQLWEDTIIKIVNYHNHNQMWATNTIKYFENTIRDIVDPII